VFAYFRELSGHKILVANNLTGAPLTAILRLSSGDLEGRQRLKDLLSGSAVDLRRTDEGTAISLEPYQALWLEL
jgi:hypothetical protein